MAEFDVATFLVLETESIVEVGQSPTILVSRLVLGSESIVESGTVACHTGIVTRYSYELAVDTIRSRKR